MREKFSEKELEQLRQMQAKKKRIERHDKEFFAEVDERRDEIIARLKIAESQPEQKDRFADVMKMYETEDEETLKAFFTEQKKFWKGYLAKNGK